MGKTYGVRRRRAIETAIGRHRPEGPSASEQEYPQRFAGLLLGRDGASMVGLHQHTWESSTGTIIVPERPQKHKSKSIRGMQSMYN
jgi:hypothetical protein